MVQKSFFKNKSEFSKARISHGGDMRGKRKAFRPLDRKKPVHVVLKSSHAKGRLSFITNKLKVNDVITQRASAYGITVHGLQIMGNHIHLALSFKTRKTMQDFLRVVPGIIARVVTGARKGKAFGKRFWDHLAFTRIITGRRDFASIKNYFFKNQSEREDGPLGRKAIEGAEDLIKQAKRRKISVEELIATGAYS